jgi:chorismate synthase
VFQGKSTGAPISILIANKDADPSKYEPLKDVLRPGHATFTYTEKYGIFDYRGGGRASARETASRVAAGAIAARLLDFYGIGVTAYIKQIGEVVATIDNTDINTVKNHAAQSPLFCPDKRATEAIAALINATRTEGDSLGGLVEFVASPMPIGLGDPVYHKLEASLAYAMMSIPASKGFEMGSGFSCVTMRGSQHNDVFIKENGHTRTRTNHAGGTLGGISTGMPLIGRVAFKPTSSIAKPQETLTIDGKASTLQLPEGSRHDPCVAIRAVPVVEAMVALVLADAILHNRSAKL